MTDNRQDRYEILRQLALKGSDGESLDKTARSALEDAATLLGLSAAAMYLWDDNMKVSLSVISASEDRDRERLAALEDNLFRSLRRDSELLSAYMSFGGASPCHSFTLPLRRRERVFGAVIGLHTGKRSLVTEDEFLEALSASIALSALAAGSTQTAVPQEILDKERLSAIIETAVTVNHEINNPLTAILGNVQLLLMNGDAADVKLVGKLKVIEESANRIKDVTQKLLRMTTPRSVEYAEGTSMIDITDRKPPEDDQINDKTSSDK
ncbi:MAG: hypothetical protein KKA42_11930 [candidate division Zixibacteria bacterium]|nr:hypothetical protein [candidate division Zixibacteria bacterium]